MARITEFVIETGIGGIREALNQFVITCVIACEMVHSEDSWILHDGIEPSNFSLKSFNWI